MFNIADYLKKFARIEGESTSQKEAIARAMKEICGIDNIPTELRKGILYVKAPPAARALVFTKKAALLAAFKSSVPPLAIFDIR